LQGEVPGMPDEASVCLEQLLLGLPCRGLCRAVLARRPSPRGRRPERGGAALQPVPRCRWSRPCSGRQGCDAAVCAATLSNQGAGAGPPSRSRARADRCDPRHPGAAHLDRQL